MTKMKLVFPGSPDFDKGIADGTIVSGADLNAETRRVEGLIKLDADGVGGQELFYLDKDGVKQDAALHEEMLAGDHADADQVGIEQARKCGLTEDEIVLLYGPQPPSKR